MDYPSNAAHMIPDDYDSDSGSVYFRAYINGKITHSFISVEREKNIITFKDLRHEIERDLTLPFLHFRLLLGIDAVVSPNRIQEEMWCVSEYRLMDSGNGSLERMPLLSHIAYQFRGYWSHSRSPFGFVQPQSGC